jgi:replicative DNA helicase
VSARNPDYRSLVHTPAELASEYVQWAKERHDNPGVTWGVPALDKQMMPARPGELVGILGRPGMGKTSLLAYVAMQEANRIVARGKQGEECVVYVTWESSSEELSNFFLASDAYSVSDIAWGRVPIEKVEKESLRLLRRPIWVIGMGIGRIEAAGIKMTPKVVYETIETMHVDFGVKPTLACFDYLQVVSSATHADRVQAVAEAPIKIKELALTIGTPAFVGVQASRDVDGYKVKIPAQKDCQWGSSVEQAADKLVALWRPALTEEQGSVIELDDGSQYIVNDTLLVIRKLKERFNSGRSTLAMYFDPAYLKLAELEKRNLDDGAMENTWYATDR